MTNWDRLRGPITRLDEALVLHTEQNPEKDKGMFSEEKFQRCPK